MFYKKLPASDFLSQYVECFYVWERALRPETPLTIGSPPNGRTSMVFNYGDEYGVFNNKYVATSVPRAFFSGQATESYQLQLGGKIGMIGAVFRPAALYTLFGIPMYEMTDERVCIEDVLGNEGHVLSDSILNADTLEQRIALLDKYLSRKLLQSKVTFDRTDYVANLILNRSGMVDMKALEEDLYVCQRQFQRLFLKKVGVSAKHFSRISRIASLSALMASRKWKVGDWHDLVLKYGYYDQSHLIREFNSFMHKTPALYIRENEELGNYVS